MPRIPRIVFPIVVFLALAPEARAGIPPDYNVIPETLTLSVGEEFPGNPIGKYAVHIEGSIGPIAGARVVVRFAEGADVALAPGQPDSAEGFTNSSGDVTFHFEGSGCYTAECLGFPPATVSVYVDGELHAQGDVVVVNSPSPVDAAGLTRCEGGAKCDELNNESVGTVGVADAVWVTPAIKLGLIEPCAKFTPPYNDPVNLDDTVFITPYIKLGRTCGCTP